MDLLFKLNDTTVDESTAVIAQSNFEEHYPNVNANSSWKQFKTFIRQATESFIIPFLGEKFYDDLVEKYKSDSLDELESKVVSKMQDSIAYYTIYKALPSLNVMIGDGGVMQNITDRANPTPQWAFYKAWRQALSDADSYRDTLLNYLDKQCLNDENVFELYRKSEEAKTSNSNYFRSSADLQEFIPIRGSRITYNALIPYLRKAEESKARTILGKEIEALLITAVDKGNDNEHINTLLAVARALVAHTGLYNAIPYLTIKIQEEGFKIVSFGDGMEDNRNLTNNTHQSAIAHLRAAAELNMKQAEHELIAVLYKNEAHYPEWSNSEARKRTESKGGRIISTKQGGIFI